MQTLLRTMTEMNFVNFMYVAALLCCSFGNAEDCKASAAPPDPKSGCCGKAVGVTRIIPGLYTQLSEYPWMGAIEYQKENKTKLLCSAVLISGRYMLSAAQCFGARAMAIGTPTNVRLGEYDTSNDGPDCLDDGGSKECNDGAVKVPIEKVIKHPDYHKEQNYQDDIALIRLAETVRFTDFIQPICLPSSDISVDPPSRPLWSAGWGSLSSADISASAQLHHVDIPFVDLVKCQSAFNISSKRQIKLTNKQMCAGGNGKDTCRGDSGGPLMHVRDHTTEVAGIVSFGAYPCGQIGMPSVYTNVFAYDSWIRQHIQE